ncbi:MAG: hypothetical protein ACKV2V_02685 [Blastocatellia bacterium]
MRAGKYQEGFRLSVYGLALDGLTDEELKELEPDFARIAAGLPENVDVAGEQITGDTATVFVRMPGQDKPQGITLMRVDGRWIVGDKETHRLVTTQGRQFFFLARMQVSEQEAVEWLEEIYGAQTIFFKAKNRFTALDELVRLGGVSPQLSAGMESGYRFEVLVTPDGQKFTVTAIPARYGRTGRRSFFVDQTGVIRVEDKQGQPATAASPKHMIRG